ncbi:hypothetical protein GRI39_08570 [Altererythrobacter indicus]|uniref:Recombinase n=1 Tax=Altericroceibacterium indicum TaxID=374177 RepID=A0A845AG19_9SPHN|nr:hypothetical protein [Altericroceibacterium indicum]MXP26088.1 hypothetical protein [Altericroceibacterium indicum]
MAKLLDRIVDASSDSVVKAYEQRIAKLEREKLVWQEKSAKLGKPKHTFSEMFEHTLRFLANPSKLWENGDIIGRRTTLRLLFSGHLVYCRNEGFRTPETSNVFKALGEFSVSGKAMAETEGFEPSVPG